MKGTKRVFLLLTCLTMTAAVRPLFAQAPQPSLSAAVEVASTNVFVNEEFRLTLVVQLKGVRAQKDIDVLGLPSSSALHLGQSGEFPTIQSVENGQACEVRRTFYLVRAPQAGPLVLAPTLRVGVLTGRRHFFTDAPEVAMYDLQVRPLVLQVLPLPDQGRPPSFSGAVGQFSFDVDVAPTNIVVGTLIRVVPRIHGTGYMETVSSPRVSQSPHFRVYDPKPVPGRDGERIFEQIIIPQNTNALTIPAVSFSYFEPRVGTYRTIARGPFPLSFGASTNTPPSSEPYRPPAGNIGASTTRTPPLQSPGQKPAAGILGPTAWLVVAVVAGLCLLVVLIAGGETRARYPAARPVGLLVLIVVLILSLSMGVRSGWFAKPEAIVVKREVARFAPAFSAATSFELPEGSSVRIAEIRGDWAKISQGRRRGWIPTEALKSP